MQLNQDKAVVVFSGGQDSTTCLFWALQNFKEVFTLSFDYGQRHQQEVAHAEAIAKELGVSFHIMPMHSINELSPNALTKKNIPIAKRDDGLPNTFVPGRNHIFFSFAALYAYAVDARHIITGVSETDFSGYPDCRDNFMKSLNVTLNLAMDADFVLHTPLMWCDKAEVWALSDELGAFDFVREKTLTCYEGIAADGCGECPACVLRREGLVQYLASKDATQ